MPVNDLDSALEQLHERFSTLLSEYRLQYQTMRVMGTPRRLVVWVDELAPRQLDQEQLVKGPPAERAYSPEGKPTQAAIGFAKSKGVSVKDLEIREMDGGRYVVAVLRQAGRPTWQVMSEALPTLIAALRFDKSMRWNSVDVYFSRPIRWLLALHGDQVLPFEYARVHSGKKTRGLRFHQSEEIEVNHPSEYFNAMRAQGILLDGEERKDYIKTNLQALASEVDGEIDTDEALLSEVTNLVEAPVILRGVFDTHHLQLPREVLISVMKKHQRYFPVERNGRLLPYFMLVANKPPKDATTCEGAEEIIQGNQHVLAARFADAAYFIREDLKQSLDNFLPRLGTLTFQEKLGSMLEKVRRIQSLVEDLAPMINLTPEQLQVARRAAELCKADLATNMVVEMTSLQGIMGKYYALKSGESESVAEAIYEHYLPRFAGDEAPSTLPGMVVGLADRLDTLIGLFAAGLAPSGSKDPFALRRAALSLVQNLITWELNFDIRAGLDLAAKNLPIHASRECKLDCLEFILERLRNLWLEQGFRYDVVEAVLAAQGSNPYRASRAVASLSNWVKREDWHTILPAYARCVRITRDVQESYEVNPQNLVEEDEKTLFQALLQAENTPRATGSVDDFLNAFLPMIPAINRFFDEVLVMTDEQHLRENRLGLLQRIVSLADGVADMSKLEGF